MELKIQPNRDENTPPSIACEYSRIRARIPFSRPTAPGANPTEAATGTNVEGSSRLIARFGGVRGVERRRSVENSLGLWDWVETGPLDGRLRGLARWCDPWRLRTLCVLSPNRLPCVTRDLVESALEEARACMRRRRAPRTRRGGRVKREARAPSFPRFQ